ncbi:MAG: hypothetical protein KDH09_19470 [Chrysiogenetes bacterium]|nr:hypothetical protein [Chrysiogenetes bacterium]
MSRTILKDTHRILLLTSIFAYVLFGVGGTVGVGLCFEADGHVGLEIMRGGSCTSSQLAFDSGDNEHRAEHAGFSSDEHCASCTDVSLPIQELRARRVSDDLGMNVATPVIVPSLLKPTVRALAAPQPRRSHSPVLPALSTIVLRT